MEWSLIWACSLFSFLFSPNCTHHTTLASSTQPLRTVEGKMKGRGRSNETEKGEGCWGGTRVGKKPRAVGLSSDKSKLAPKTAFLV